MQLRGVSGRLARGYAVAVELGPYTVTRLPEDACCHLTATVTAVVDPFQLTQLGLCFVAPIGARHWSWTVEAHVLEGGTLTARLSGRPETT